MIIVPTGRYPSRPSSLITEHDVEYHCIIEYCIVMRTACGAASNNSSAGATGILLHLGSPDSPVVTCSGAYTRGPRPGSILKRIGFKGFLCGVFAVE